MKFVSIDIETTGLDSDACQVLEFAAVLVDTELPFSRSNLPTFSAIVVHPEIHGDPAALAMNAELIKKIADVLTPSGGIKPIAPFPEYCEPDEVAAEFRKWLTLNGVSKPTFAGKNVAGFDLPFLRKLVGWDSVGGHHRVLDPGSMYAQPKHEYVPGLREIMEMIPKSYLHDRGFYNLSPHKALDDALMVAIAVAYHWELS